MDHCDVEFVDRLPGYQKMERDLVLYGSGHGIDVNYTEIESKVLDFEKEES